LVALQQTEETVVVQGTWRDQRPWQLNTPVMGCTALLYADVMIPVEHHNNIHMKGTPNA